MQRSRATLADVAGWANLARAFQRAAGGASHRAAVRDFASSLETKLTRLQQGILENSVELGQLRRFSIRDPKPRVIHAPCFHERVLHHAVLAVVGPVHERAMVADSFACRRGKGPLAAVHRAQRHVRSHAWFVKADVRAYFDNVDHARLRGLLARRFKDAGLLALLERIVDAYSVTAARPRGRR